MQKNEKRKVDHDEFPSLEMIRLYHWLRWYG